jgi:hypothetical protein
MNSLLVLSLLTLLYSICEIDCEILSIVSLFYEAFDIQHFLNTELSELWQYSHDLDESSQGSM